MSRFEGTVCDSCGISIHETQKTGWAEVTFWGLGESERYDLCPKCAKRVRLLFGDNSAHEKGQKRGEE